MPGHGANPLEHVLDHTRLEIPWVTPPTFELKIPLPQIFGLQITRFMVMELIAAVLMIVVMVPVVRHIARNHVSRGWFMNMFEAMLLFIRDEVARPAIGGHGADRFLPYLWTVFFFVLFNNLLGMIPGGASATGNINVTAVLALMTLVVVVMAGIARWGSWATGWASSRTWTSRCAQAAPLGPDVRHRGRRALDPAHRAGRSSIRQHVRRPRGAGGHPRLHPDGLGSNWSFYLVMPASIIGVILLSLLELFVAFLQAYIFTFLVGAVHRGGGPSALSVTASAGVAARGVLESVDRRGRPDRRRLNSVRVEATVVSSRPAGRREAPRHLTSVAFSTKESRVR